MNMDHLQSSAEQPYQGMSGEHLTPIQSNNPLMQSTPSEIDTEKVSPEAPLKSANGSIIEDDLGQQNEDQITKSEEKDKKKSKRQSSSQIQEKNIIKGERLRTRNPPQAQLPLLQKEGSQSSSEQGKAGSNTKPASKKGKQTEIDWADNKKKQNFKIFESNQGQHPLRESYVSKTPDILIQFIDDIMLTDKIDSLRRQHKDSLIDNIPNLSKFSERKKSENLVIKDMFGQNIEIFSKDSDKLKKEVPSNKATSKEQDRIQEEQNKQEEDEKNKQPEIKDLFGTPSKDIFSQFGVERPTPHKLLNEDFLLDETQGQQPIVQEIPFLGDDCNQNKLHDLINDELLNQIDEQYHQNNLIQMELSSFDPRNMLNQHDMMLHQRYQGNHQEQNLAENNNNGNQHFCSTQDTSHNQDGKQQQIEEEEQIHQQQELEYQNIQNEQQQQQQQQQYQQGQQEGQFGVFSDDIQQPSIFQQNKEINSEALNYLSELNIRGKDIINMTKITSIESIRERAIENVYFSFEEVDKDFKKLFMYTLYKRCNSRESINYMCNLIEQYMNQCQRKSMKSKILQNKQQDLQRLYKLDIENKLQVKNWPFIPSSHRTYECITEYSPEPPSNKPRINEVLKSEKKVVECSNNCCCFDLKALGNFSFEMGTWNSDCPNRKERIECSHHDCKNSQSTHSRQKILGQDVKETLCWGIDQYTKKNIFHILPENESDEVKFKFIQRSLLKSSNLSDNEGWDMAKVCDFIICNSESKKSRYSRDNSKPKIKYIFSTIDRKFAKIILKAVELNLDQEAFRIHPKGMGVICLNRNGIQHNDLIIKYIGEIYRPYRWFERQDFVKKYMKDNNQKDVLPDFYNIMLELHKNEGKGIDILYVDPMQKGNYSSRLSHSCDPNCGTVPTIANQTYNISMFAMKDIEYGEELAFDYSAVTESKAEHKQSTCLCGTQKCRGKYIELSNNNQKEYNYILDKTNCFLKRNADLLRSGSEPLSSEDFELLNRYNLKKNVQTGCENWLLKWIAITLKTVQDEKETFLNDQLVSNKFLVQSNKEIDLIKKAIALKQSKDLPYFDTNKLEEEDEGEKAERKNEQKVDSSEEEKNEYNNRADPNDRNEFRLEEEQENEAMQIEEYKEKEENLNNEEGNNISKNKEAPILNQMKKNEILENDSEMKDEQINQEGDIATKEDEEAATITIQKEEDNIEKDEEEVIQKQKPHRNKSSQYDYSKKRKLRKPPKRLTAEETEKKLEEQRVASLVENYEEIELFELQKEKEKERVKNIEIIKYIATAREENRVQNVIISLDKVKFYLNNLGDSHPPLRYLSPQEIVANIWGGIAKLPNKKTNGRVKYDNISILSIAEELLDLLKYSNHHAECSYAIKFFELLKIQVVRLNSKSPEKALLLFRLACLNIHKVFSKIENPQIHSGALEIILYFYSFTHTYFAPHEYAMFNSEKMTITESEMFNLELLDEDKKVPKKNFKKKLYEEQRQYSSQFVWGQLTGWFKQTVASPQATLSQDRRGTLSYPQLHQSFKTNSQAYPFQEKNDVIQKTISNKVLIAISQKNPRQAFLNHVKERSKDMWPPDQAKWSFKNSLRNYGTLFFEGMHSRGKFENLTEKVIDKIDSSFDEKFALFIEVEVAISGMKAEEIKKMQTHCFEVIKKELDKFRFYTTLKTVEQMEQDYKESVQKKVINLRQIRRKKNTGNGEDYYFMKKAKRYNQESDEEECNGDNEEDDEDGEDNEDEYYQEESEQIEEEEEEEIEQEQEKEQSKPPAITKKRHFSECILNSEKDCFLEEGADLNEIIKNPQKLKKHLIIEINLAYLNKVHPKFEKEFKKLYSNTFTFSNYKSEQYNGNSIKNEEEGEENEYNNSYEEQSYHVTSQQKGGKKPKSKIGKPQKPQEGVKKTQSYDERRGKVEKQSVYYSNNNDEFDDFSIYRFNNEDSRKSNLSNGSQNSQDNHRRSSRVTTKYNYDKLISKKVKHYE